MRPETSQPLSPLSGCLACLCAHIFPGKQPHIFLKENQEQKRCSRSQPALTQHILVLCAASFSACHVSSPAPRAEATTDSRRRGLDRQWASVSHSQGPAANAHPRALLCCSIWECGPRKSCLDPFSRLLSHTAALESF